MPYTCRTCGRPVPTDMTKECWHCHPVLTTMPEMLIFWLVPDTADYATFRLAAGWRELAFLEWSDSTCNQVYLPVNLAGHGVSRGRVGMRAHDILTGQFDIRKLILDNPAMTLTRPSR